MRAKIGVRALGVCIALVSLSACENSVELPTIPAPAVQSGVQGLASAVSQFPELADSVVEVRVDPVTAGLSASLTDAELIAAVRRSEGIVAVGFKPSNGRYTRESGVIPAMSRSAAMNARADIQQRGGTLLQTFRTSSSVVIRIAPELAPELRSLPYVNFLVPETRAFPAQSPPPQQIGWGVTRVGADLVWPIVGAGDLSTVTILDSGLDSTHLASQSLDGPAFLGYCAWVVAAASSCYQGPVHGSHVAGIISARNNSVGIIGIANTIGQFNSVRVCNIIGNCADQWIAAGLEWAVGIQRTRHVVNLSLQGCDPLPLTAEQIARAHAAGLLVIVAAGNTSFSCAPSQPPSATGVMFPARYQDVIAVSGTLTDDSFATSYQEGCGFGASRSGPEVDLSAPFWALSMVGNGLWHVHCGTSMAAPVVTAVAALVWTAYPNWTAPAVRMHLQLSAVDLGTPGHDHLFGYGRVSAYNALYPATPPLTVSIAGFDLVQPAATCTWTAGASGGTPPYTYEWQANGQVQGSGSTLFYTNAGSSFDISVTARDANNQIANNGMFVVVDSGASECLDQ